MELAGETGMACETRSVSLSRVDSLGKALASGFTSGGEIRRFRTET